MYKDSCVILIEELQVDKQCLKAANKANKILVQSLLLVNFQIIIFNKSSALLLLSCTVSTTIGRLMTMWLIDITVLFGRLIQGQNKMYYSLYQKVFTYHVYINKCSPIMFISISVHISCLYQ